MISRRDRGWAGRPGRPARPARRGRFTGWWVLGGVDVGDVRSPAARVLAGGRVELTRHGVSSPGEVLGHVSRVAGDHRRSGAPAPAIGRGWRPGFLGPRAIFLDLSKPPARRARRPRAGTLGPRAVGGSSGRILSPAGVPRLARNGRRRRPGPGPGASQAACWSCCPVPSKLPRELEPDFFSEFAGTDVGRLAEPIRRDDFFLF